MDSELSLTWPKGTGKNVFISYRFSEKDQLREISKCSLRSLSDQIEILPVSSIGENAKFLLLVLVVHTVVHWYLQRLV